MFKLLFWLFVYAGRPWGGIRPRRVTHWLARKAYGQSRPHRAEYRWYRDRYGAEFLLHPHFHLDYSIIAFGTFDSRLGQFIERQVGPGMTCLDVGANLGVFSLQLARKVGPAGVVHCFEPLPGIFQRLREHVEHNGFRQTVRAHQLALADRDTYYADPHFADVPLAGLLTPEYAALRRELIDPKHASLERRPGDPRSKKAVLGPADDPARRHVPPGRHHRRTRRPGRCGEESISPTATLVD